MGKKIAIVAALERELRPLVKTWPWRKVEYQDREFRFYEGEHAVVVCGGVGSERSRRAAEAIIVTCSPQLVISAGVSGALVGELHVGDTIFPSTVIDTEDSSRHATAIRRPPAPGTAWGRTILVSHSKIATAAEKRWLAESYGAHAVDMESAGVARAAQLHGLPFLAIKSISDELDFVLPEMAQFIEHGDFRTARFLFHVALRPWLWLPVVRLAHNTGIAARNLCAWLRPGALINTIVPSTIEPEPDMVTARQLRGENLGETIPATMSAAVYRGVNDVRLERVPVPEIGAEEILVRVDTCGICGTDLKKIATGSHSAPRIFGHETAGVVARVGRNVHQFSPGDRVIFFHHIPCGHCYYCQHKTFAQCPTYKKVGCSAGFEPAGGGFAEYVRVMDWIVRHGTVRIPDGVSFEQAAFVEPVNTCMKGIERIGLLPGETVLVIGQGPIGIILSVLAKRSGARVITSDLYEQRLTISRGFGLENAVNASRLNPVQETLRQTESRGADAVILAVGSNALIQTAMDAVRPGGRVLLFAQTQHGQTAFDPAAVCMDEKTLIGSYSASMDLQDESVRFVMGREMALDNLISHRFPLERVVEALNWAALPQPNTMKIVVQPSQEGQK